MTSNNVLSQFVMACMWCGALMGADSLVYTDNFTSGWSDASYGVTTNYCVRPAAQGFCALSAQFNRPWSGLRLNSTPKHIGPYNAVSFYIKGGFSPATPEVYLTLFGNSQRLSSVQINQYIPGGLGFNWTLVQIPLADLGVKGPDIWITALDIESNLANHSLYLDELKFTQIVVPDQSVLYEEYLPFGWRDTSYGLSAGTHNFNSPVHLNGKSGISLQYERPWTGFSLSNSFGVETKGRNVLSFAVNSGTADADLYVILGTAGNSHLGIRRVLDYISGHKMTANEWYVVNIPLVDLNAVDVVLNRVSLESAMPANVYLDDFYIGHHDPFILFKGGVGAKWIAETSGASGYIELNERNIWVLRIDYSVAWGGLYINDFRNGGVDTRGKQVLTLSFSLGPIGEQDVYLSVYGKDVSKIIGMVRLRDYLPPMTKVVPGTWYDVVVPLSALDATDTTVTRIALTSDRLGVVWFNNIQIGDFLLSPLL